jgi:hypothetical protein
MKRVQLMSFAIVFCLILIFAQSPITLAYEDTQCFQCHTSAKHLIEATREIAKTRPALKSSETEGEG